MIEGRLHLIDYSLSKMHDEFSGVGRIAWADLMWAGRVVLSLKGYQPLGRWTCSSTFVKLTAITYGVRFRYGIVLFAFPLAPPQDDD
jgi:hypothetical protein